MPIHSAGCVDEPVGCDRRQRLHLVVAIGRQRRTLEPTMAVMLSGPPRRLAMSTSTRTASCGDRRRKNGADLLVLDLPAQAVAAQQKRVAGFERKRPFQIDLHVGVRAERAGDDVLGNEVGDVAARQSARRPSFPKPGCDRTSVARAATCAADRRGCRRRARRAPCGAAAPARCTSCPCPGTRRWPGRGREWSRWRRRRLAVSASAG